MTIKCRKCGATPNDGVWLERVNEKGIPGIWECRPDCSTRLPQDELLIAAIKGEEDAKHE